MKELQKQVDKIYKKCVNLSNKGKIEEAVLMGVSTSSYIRGLNFATKSAIKDMKYIKKMLGRDESFSAVKEEIDRVVGSNKGRLVKDKSVYRMLVC